MKYKSLIKLLLISACLSVSLITPYSWSGLASNQIVNGSNLQDAVDNNILYLNPGQTITKTTGAILRSEANTILEIDPITNDNRAVKKSELVAAAPIACGTTITYDAEPRSFTWEKSIYLGSTSGSVQFTISIWDFQEFKIEIQYEGGSWVTVCSRDETIGPPPNYVIHWGQNSFFYSYTYNTSSLIRMRVTKVGDSTSSTSSDSTIVVSCPV